MMITGPCARAADPRDVGRRPGRRARSRPTGASLRVCLRTSVLGWPGRSSVRVAQRREVRGPRPLAPAGRCPALLRLRRPDRGLSGPPGRGGGRVPAQRRAPGPAVGSPDPVAPGRETNPTGAWANRRRGEDVRLRAKRTQWLSGGPGSGNGARSSAGRFPRTNPAPVSIPYVSKRVPEPVGRESRTNPAPAGHGDETKPIGPGNAPGGSRAAGSGIPERTHGGVGGARNEPNGGLGNSAKGSGHDTASETNPTGVGVVRERNEVMKSLAKRTQWGSGQTTKRTQRRSGQAPERTQRGSGQSTKRTQRRSGGFASLQRTARRRQFPRTNPVPVRSALVTEAPDAGGGWGRTAAVSPNEPSDPGGLRVSCILAARRPRPVAVDESEGPTYKPPIPPSGRPVRAATGRRSRARRLARS
jgi:hypothetical protein